MSNISSTHTCACFISQLSSFVSVGFVVLYGLTFALPKVKAYSISTSSHRVSSTCRRDGGICHGRIFYQLTMEISLVAILPIISCFPPIEHVARSMTIRYRKMMSGACTCMLTRDFCTRRPRPHSNGNAINVPIHFIVAVFLVNYISADDVSRKRFCHCGHVESSALIGARRLMLPLPRYRKLFTVSSRYLDV